MPSTIPTMVVPTNKGFEATKSMLHTSCQRLSAVSRGPARRYAPADSASPWTLAIENAFDKRYWKESPYQFGHVYLFPGAPRTLRLGLSVAL